MGDTDKPVAWVECDGDLVWNNREAAIGRNLYTHPPQRKPLTDEEIVDAVRQADLDWQAGWTLDEHEPNRLATLVRVVEQAHGIGGKE